MMTLDFVKKGQKAEILSINTFKVPLKLIEMGCLPGNIVEVLQIAPLSDPIYIKVNDSFLSIRKDLAKEIEVKMI
ncbi:ferrous iron transport protein A [Flavobacterium sp. CBA20B-1]|uniref:Ferrous iron transport protein A n=1 Tax=Paenimyroides aestuarii TaxID=2968490 RepID=A0ABY5NUS7_9FLAO|nr:MULTISPECIES: FeoA family protein [Flavobacteriaceae]UUV22152.1 ferrous iron transport protein A [Paenimyroides aestuarii]WCM41422.1 ferrous iron transport protein A [Flavobacterium sp. CBA20B-1]